MADTPEQRLADVEQILAHLPDDLDARFAGADARAGARFDRLMVRLQALETRVQSSNVALSTQIAALEGKLDELLKRLPPSP
jgi:hypothetical protein